MTTIEQVTDFLYVPREWPVHDGAQAAQSHTVSWVRQMRLVRSPEAERMNASWNIALTVACALPRARDTSLDYISDWVTWAFFLDDTLSSIWRDPQRVAGVLDDVSRVIQHDPAAPLPESLRGSNRALRDLMQRAATVMSDTWLARFRASQEEMLGGFLAKCLALSGEATPDVDEIMAIRRYDIGMEPAMDLIDMLEGFEVPPLVLNSPALRRARRLVCELIVLQNDVFSLYRDQDDGNELNSVLTVERVRQVSRMDALQYVRSMYRERLDAFHAAIAECRTTCAAMGLEARDQALMATYFEDLENLVPGTCHGHLLAARYHKGAEFFPLAISELLADHDGSRIRPLPVWQP